MRLVILAFGIIAVGACLLMIAGEFDLSIGSMIGFSGMVLAIGSIHFGLPVWQSIILAYILSIALGAVNGMIVIKTKLPSFIVTLAFLYIDSFNFPSIFIFMINLYTIVLRQFKVVFLGELLAAGVKVVFLVKNLE